MGRAPNRAVGFLDDDFSRPMIGVASLFSTITPFNAQLDRLARAIGAGKNSPAFGQAFCHGGRMGAPLKVKVG